MILVSVLLGAILGYLFDVKILTEASILIEPLSYAIVFVSGLSVGYSLNGRKLKKHLIIDVFAMPIFISIGSIVGAMLLGGFAGFNFWQSGLMASGLGWYSLSAIMISDYDIGLAAMALMINVFREIFAIATIPFIARYVGFFFSLSAGGATSMDTTLPVISRSTNEDTTIIAFANGAILIIVVPALVEIFINIGFK